MLLWLVMRFYDQCSGLSAVIAPYLATAMPTSKHHFKKHNPMFLLCFIAKGVMRRPCRHPIIRNRAHSFLIFRK
jgi:hypothetical protein